MNDKEGPAFGQNIYTHTFPDIQKVNHSNIYVVVNFLFQLIFVFSLFQIN